MKKKKRKAKSTARTTVVVSEKLKHKDIRLVANMIMYKLQDDGINVCDEKSLRAFERYVYTTIKTYINPLN